MNPVSADRSATLPGWAISVALHAGLLFLAATQLQSCTGSRSSDGEATEGFREVGIRLRGESPTDDAPDPTTAAAAPTAAAEAADAADPLSTADAADAAAHGPAATAQSDAVPTLGPGAGAAGGETSSTAPPATAGEVADPGALASAAKRGVTEFFGIRAEAESFVYVVDCSGSMQGDGEFAVAKRELLSSLATLTPKQRFQIVFFNDAPRPMTERARKEGGFYPATSFNKTLAGQFVASVSAGGGTGQIAALRAALRLEPDAVFFLSDANTPIGAADLAQIRRANRSGARIHCVEFGRGRLLREGRLAPLAEDNGGGYQYRDVTDLR